MTSPKKKHRTFILYYIVLFLFFPNIVHAHSAAIFVFLYGGVVLIFGLLILPVLGYFLKRTLTRYSANGIFKKIIYHIPIYLLYSILGVVIGGLLGYCLIYTIGMLRSPTGETSTFDILLYGSILLVTFISGFTASLRILGKQK